MPHDAALIDGNGGYACANVHKGHAGGHLHGAQDRPCNHIRKEILLGNCNAQLIEDLVQGNGCSAFADEHLEIALQGAAQSSHNLAFHKLDLVVNGERLSHGAVHDLLLRIGEGIGLKCNGLEGLDFFGRYILFRISALYAARCSHLGDLAAGHTHHNLQDVDHELFLCLGNSFLEALGCLHGVGNHTGPDTIRRRFPVIHNLDVVADHPGYAQSELGTSKIN